MHQFPKFIPAWNSNVSGSSSVPSSGVYSLYTWHWCMSYKFEDSFQAGPGWNWFYSVAGGYTHWQQNKTSSILQQNKTGSILVLLESCLQTCMTYTSAECMVNKLLMMGEELPETCRVSCRSKFGKLVHLVGFIIKKDVCILFCLQYHITLYSYYTTFFLTFHVLPSIVYFSLPQGFFLSLFFPPFLSAFSIPAVEEKSMNYETGYFHDHTSFSIDTERWCQFSEAALIAMIWESLEERVRGWTTFVLIFGRSEGPPLHHHNQTVSGTCLVHCLIQTRNNVDHEADHSLAYIVKV